MNHSDPTPLPGIPWWRVRVLWLVFGGPLAVVVAGVATLFIAIAHPDPVLVAPRAASPAEQPAVAARNHAAAPVK
jgi:hypothetical protein